MSARVQVNAGEAAELGCEVASGSPRPEIVWSRQVRTFRTFKQNKEQAKNLTKMMTSPQPLSLDNLIMMKSHFLLSVNMLILIQ